MPARLTVVIPVWDSYVDRFLADAVDSVLRQDLDARVLVIDNASRPPVGELPGVEVLRSPERLTVGGARNLGLSAVRSPAVLFWDADDEMLPGTLRRLEERLDATAGVVAAAAGILERPGVAHHWPRPVAEILARRPWAFALAHTLSSQFPTTGSVLLRTAAVLDAGGFADADGGDDWVLGASLAFRGRVVFDPRPGRIYRQHADSLSAAWTLPDYVDHARHVRRRLRHDRAVPWLVRRGALALAPLQLLVVFVVGPLARVRPKKTNAPPP